MARAVIGIALVAVLALVTAPAAMGATNFTFSEHDLASEEALSALYERWCAHHGLTRDTGEKGARRFSIFKDKARVVHEFNLGDAPYKLALNDLSDTRGYGGSCVFRDLEAARTRTRHQGFAHRGALAASELPTEIDWRKCEVLPPVKRQGRCGSCWAFAAVSAIEGIFAIKNNSLTALSEQQILDCAGSAGNCSGGSVMGAFEYVYNHGLATEHDYPYEYEKSFLCEDNDKDMPPVAFISDWEVLPENDATALMEQVARQPVAVLVWANSTAFENYEKGVFVGPCDGTTIDHAVTVVGNGTTAGGSNYWILRNSWGRNWGEGGYMRISRDVGGPKGLCGILDYPMFPSCSGNCTHKSQIVLIE